MEQAPQVLQLNLNSEITKPVKRKRRPISQAFHRLTHWNKLKQDDKKEKKQRHRKPSYETVLLPKSKTFGNFRNAAHPRKARFITTIHGMLLPTIFDDEPTRYDHNINNAATNLSLADILAFDQHQHSQVQQSRRSALSQIKRDRNHASDSALDVAGATNSATWKNALEDMIDKLGVTLKMDVNEEPQLPASVPASRGTASAPYDIMGSTRGSDATGAFDTALMSPPTAEERAASVKEAKKSRPTSVLEALDTERGVLGSASRRILQARLGSRHSQDSAGGSKRASTSGSSATTKADDDSIVQRISNSVGDKQFTSEMMIYLLCQIFQTTHVEQVHKWLETAPDGDREYVIGLLRTAIG